MQKFDFTIYLANVWLSNESQLDHYVGNHRNPHHQQFHLQELAQVIPERQEKSRHRFRGQLVELTLFYLYLGSGLNWGQQACGESTIFTSWDISPAKGPQLFAWFSINLKYSEKLRLLVFILFFFPDCFFKPGSHTIQGGPDFFMPQVSAAWTSGPCASTFQLLSL